MSNERLHEILLELVNRLIMSDTIDKDGDIFDTFCSYDKDKLIEIRDELE